MRGSTNRSSSAAESQAGSPHVLVSSSEDDYYRSYPFEVAGRLSFAEGECESDAEDHCEGTWERSDSAEIQEHSIVTEQCLDRVGETCHPDCSNESGLCECVWFKSNGYSGGGGYWGYADDETLDLDGNDQPYCVEGDRLTLLLGMGDEGYIVIYDRD